MQPDTHYTTVNAVTAISDSAITRIDMNDLPDVNTIRVEETSKVVAARLTENGELELSFENGAVLRIAGYSVTQGPTIVAADGTPIHYAHLLTPDAVPAPAAAQQVFIELIPGETMPLDFSLMDPTGLRLADGALIISFANQGEIVLQNYTAAMAADPATAVTLADGVMLTLPALPEMLASVVGLENIETAAGGGGGAGGRGGYGFQSTYVTDPLAGLDAVGEINPTALAYDTSDRRPEPLDLDILDVAVTDPNAPVVIVADERMKEDTTAQLDISATPANASQSLTITVTGFTPGWTVDTTLSGGTYDPASGTWQITLPPGVSFTGGPLVTPPHNSDIDLRGLSVTTTVTGADGTTADYTAPFNIIVDAVADTPYVSVADIPDQYWYVENRGYHVALQIDAEVTDTDGSEILTHVIIDLNQPISMPAGGFTSLASMGVTLNAGTEIEPGIWRVDINAQSGDDALAGLALVVPDNQNYQAIHQSVVGGQTVTIPVTAYTAETNLNGGEYDTTDNTATAGDSEEFHFFITPLVLDLDGNGFDLVARSEGVQFDMNNDGILDQTSWVGPADGLLALDINGDGLINNQSELFGNGPDLADGFAALAAHDDNGDGRIDSSDAVFADLRVWQDFNQDGISDEGELQSLSDLGIASIGLAAEAGDGQLLLTGSFTYTDGRTGDIADALFSVEAGTIDIHDVLAANDALPFDMTEPAAGVAEAGPAYATAPVSMPDIMPATEQIS